MKMEHYIAQTPQRLLDMLAQPREDLAECAKAMAEQGVTRLIVTGSGTSWHGALTARGFMQRWCGLPVEAAYPFMLDADTLSGGGKALLIGISQGGGSLSTLQAMQRARQAGHLTASMAGCTRAVIDGAADFVLTVPCGEETAGAKTKGYHCTVLNLMLLALAIARQSNRLTPEEKRDVFQRMETTFHHLPAVIDASQTWITSHCRELAALDDIRLVAPGSLYGTVQEGALKMLETLRCPVSGYEFEEFIHGIYNAFNPGSALIMLTPAADPRYDSLETILSDWTPWIWRIGAKAENSPRTLACPFINDPDFNVFEFIIPLQLLCAMLAPLKGINPAIPKDPQFHQKMKSKQC